VGAGGESGIFHEACCYQSLQTVRKQTGNVSGKNVELLVGGKPLCQHIEAFKAFTGRSWFEQVARSGSPL